MAGTWQAEVTPAQAGPGDEVVVSVRTGGGATPAQVRAWPTAMRDWVLGLALEQGRWIGRRRLPAWVAPGRYEWEIAADGEVVARAAFEVAWPPEAMARAARWRQERGRLAREEAGRWDEHWARQNLPQFRRLGVWFSGDFYSRYGNPQGPPTPDTPYSRGGALDEVRYLHEELGCNMMVLSGVDQAAQAYAREHLEILCGPGGKYRFYDEPDAQQAPMAEVADWVARTEAEGLTPIVNFCGHSEGDWWDGYAREFLRQYRAPVVSVDCYPVFYDIPNLGYFAARVREVGEWAREAGSRFLVIPQGFACLGKWAMPTPEQIVEMARHAHDAEAEGLLFFLWTSGWKGPHDEYLIGLDAMPLAYHRLLWALGGGR